MFATVFSSALLTRTIFVKTNVNLTSVWPCSPRVSHSSVVRASNRYSGRSWDRLPLGAQKNLFLSISAWELFSVIYTLSKLQSTYHLFSLTIIVNMIIFLFCIKIIRLGIWRGIQDSLGGKRWHGRQCVFPNDGRRRRESRHRAQEQRRRIL